MKTYKGKSIYNPSGKAQEYSYWACNFYVGCSNGCQYCYCKKGILSGAMGQNYPQLKKCFESEEHALSVFVKEVRKNLSKLQEYGLFFSFTTDPLLFETFSLTCESIDICLEMNIPVKVLTKCTKMIDKIIEWYGNRENTSKIAIGLTLTGHDELEQGASTNAERIEAMKQLHDAGFKTFASIEPIIDFDSAKLMIKNTEGFCDLYKIGLMSGKKYDIVETQTFIEWLIDNVDSKMYIKDSLSKYYDQVFFNENFVNRDYNIFKN